MRVLSIDLDYIMGPTIEDYNSILYDDNPTIRWEEFFSKTDSKAVSYTHLTLPTILRV